MKKPVLLLTSAIVLAGLAAAYGRFSAPAALHSSANAFLASLTPEQRAKAVHPFEPTGDEYTLWHYIPAEDFAKRNNRPRGGVPLTEMSAPQRHLAHALLSAGLSQRGYAKATNIMSLDDILRVMEGDTTGRRNSDKYFFTIFGEPSETKPWGLRVEGHHLSLHFTIVNGKVSGSPTFFGTNPAEVRQGPRKGLRVLGAEEDLARELLSALTPEQKKAAIVDAKAPADMLTAAERKAALQGQPSGLSASKMNAKQRTQLMALLEEYAYNLPEEVAAVRLKQIKDAGTNINFAWMGTETRNEGHYYRVQGPSFLVEYDNTQNGANHIHSVWRDLSADWGADLLAAHYKASPHK
jgi:hypothetical protein